MIWFLERVKPSVLDVEVDLCLREYDVGFSAKDAGFDYMVQVEEACED